MALVLEPGGVKRILGFSTLISLAAKRLSDSLVEDLELTQISIDHLKQKIFIQLTIVALCSQVLVHNILSNRGLALVRPLFK